jgi:ABC-type glycerol-3-phosphate transport system permease component
MALACSLSALIPYYALYAVCGDLMQLGGDKYFAVFSTLGAVNLLSVFVLYGRFDELIRNHREMACMDGIGEFGFLFRFVLRYSGPVIVYMGALQFLCIYCSVDWQILGLQGFWDWTVGVWAMDQGSTSAQERIAAACLAMLPVFFTLALCYPVLSRYCLVPVARKRRA